VGVELQFEAGLVVVGAGTEVDAGHLVRKPLIRMPSSTLAARTADSGPRGG